jgi:hypothetical protein
MTTKELINAIKDNANKIIEARLILKCAYATHFIYFDEIKNVFVDEGIDGEAYTISITEFYERYEKANWIIDQVV